MIFIVAKFDVKPENAESFPAVVEDFTKGTRAEPGNLWFEWSRSLEAPNEYVLIERSPMRRRAARQQRPLRRRLESMRPLLASTPKIISRRIDGEGWDEMGELVID